MRPADTLRDDDWFRDRSLQAVLAVLGGKDDLTRVIGGAVRNALLGRKVADLDLATKLLPDQVISRCDAASLKTVPTGYDHGTVTVITDKMPFEVTTLRCDVETDGRHAKVKYSTSFKEDAERRDFTINALSMSFDGAVHDYVEGLADLEAGRLRFIGDPGDRISEDFLRVLRFFRFFAWYGEASPEETVVAALKKGREGLARLSPERVGSEILKLLDAPDPIASLALMRQTEIDRAVFQFVPSHEAVVRLVRLEGELGLSPDPIRRLAALSSEDIFSAEKLRSSLRLSNRDLVRLERILRVAQTAPTGPKEIKTLLSEREDGVADGYLVAASIGDREIDTVTYEIATTWVPPKFPLNGGDLIENGIAPGPQVGAALSRARREWAASDFQADRDQLLDAVLGRVQDATE